MALFCIKKRVTYTVFGAKRPKTTPYLIDFYSQKGGKIYKKRKNNRQINKKCLEII